MGKLELRDYVPLEYVESTGVQYIDTGIIPNKGTKFIIDMAIPYIEELALNYVGVLQRTSSDDYIRWQCGSYYNRFLRAHRGNKGNTGIYIDKEFDESRHIFILSGEEMGVDDTSRDIIYIDDVKLSFGLFGHTYEYGVHPGYFKIYDYKCFQDGVLIQHFIPCRSFSGKIGMFDDVNHKYYFNETNSNLIAGPEIHTIPIILTIRHWKKSRGGRLNWVKDEDVRKVYINQETKENLVWRNGYDNVIVAKSNWSDPECEFYKRSNLDWELIEDADGNYLLGADGNIGNYIKETDVVKIENLHGLEKLKTFQLDHCDVLEEVIGIEEWDTSNRTSLQSMFRGCASFIKPDIDLSKWNVSNVTNIHYIFFNSGFTSIDLHGWDARKITTTGDVFYGSKELETLDLSNWKAPSRISFGALCYSCSALKSIDFSGWDWKNIKITSLSNAFVNCKNLENLDVTDWDISEASSIATAFRYCAKLPELNVSKWNTANVTAMNSTFEGCSGLTVLDVSKWNTGKVTNLGRTFSSCGLIKELEVSNWNTSNVENLYNTFGYCTSLINLDLHNWDVSKVTDMSYLFNVCNSLKSLDLTGWDTSNVLDMNVMFYGCRVLDVLNVKHFDTSKVRNMKRMFYQCYVLTELNLSGWNTENVTDMTELFSYSGSMKWVDISGWTIKEDTIVNGMFANCHHLTDIYAYNCDETTISILNSVKPKAATLHTGPRPAIE